MHKIINVVIDVNYGDSGKGLATDYLSYKHRKNNAVVRFNGGAQAGHRVVTPEGSEHVFKTFGSGTFARADTILSRFFMLDPIKFWEETESIAYAEDNKKFGFNNPSIDPRCRLVTPIDVIINQELEHLKGNDKHGSCGMGIGEATNRNKISKYELTVKNFTVDRLNKIVDEYLPLRLGKDFDTSKYPIKDLLQRFVNDLECILEYVDIKEDWEALLDYESIVFEGAQGLCLDEFSDDFPHVTNSRTGLTNVRTILDDMGYDSKVNVTYVTRAYNTRHGAGPLKNEIFDDLGLTEPTNHDNKWQNKFRYAPLDIERMNQDITNDLKNLNGLYVNPSLLVTHLDECEHFNLDQFNICSDLFNMLPVHSVLGSYGPTRNDIKVKFKEPKWAHYTW